MDKIAMVKTAEVRGVIACLVDNELVKVANQDEFNALSDLVEANVSENYDVNEVMNKTAEVLDALENMSDEELEELAAAIEEEQAEEAVAEEVAEDEVKEASEINETALMAAYGELAMAKEAGEISAEEFEKEAGSLRGMVEGAKNLASRAYNGDVSGAAKSIGAKAKELARNKFTGFKDTLSGASVRAAKKEYDRGVNPLNLKGLTENVDKAKKNVSSVKDSLTNANSNVSDFARKNRSTLLGKRKSELASAEKALSKANRDHAALRAPLSKAKRNRALAIGGTAAAGAGTLGAAGLGGKALYDKYNN